MGAALRGLDGVLITRLRNVRYLTGFTGSSGVVLVTREARYFLTDFRYEEQAARELPDDWEILIEPRPRNALKKLFKTAGIKTLGFESSATYGFYQSLSKTGISLKSLEEPVEKLRAEKDAREQELIREAVKRAESAFEEILPHIRAGVHERTIARRLEDKLKKKGTEVLPFDIIVAAGPNAAMPHARPTERKLSPGDLVVIDWGGECEGYFSDMTRTLLVKGPRVARQKEIYDLVLEANRAGRRTAAGGVKASAVDGAARGVIGEAGYGEFFGHGTGHGVGLEVHELPHVSGGSREVLRSGMVFTVEPGIYISGEMGVRIEDMMAIEPGGDGAETLTTLSRELKIV